MSLPRFGARTIREILEGKRNLNGTIKVTAAELQAKRTKQHERIMNAILGDKPKPKRSERSAAMALADKYFSEWIRLRDAGEDGRVTCVTCSHTNHWRQLQCGHFVTRGHQATRFNETNCNTQCRGCNYNGGQHLKHAVALDRKYGEGTAKAMEDLGARECKRTTQDFLFLANSYRSRVDWIRQHSPEKFKP